MGETPFRLASGIAALAFLVLSSVPSVVASAGIAPGAPQALHAVPNGDGTLTVVWAAPANAAVAGVDFYTIERLTAQGWAFVDQTTGTDFMDASPDLASELIVGYRVTAINAVGGEASITIQVFGRGVIDDPGCYLLEWRGGVNVAVDGACAITILTDPVPEPMSTELRNFLMVSWVIVKGVLDQSPVQVMTR